MNSRNFTCVIGEESKVYIKDIAMTGSIYLEAYWEAFETLSDMVNRTQAIFQQTRVECPVYSDIKPSNRRCPDIQNDKLYNTPSNIITFSADRGCGKTSTMLTFAKALRDFSSGLSTRSWERFCVLLEREGITGKERLNRVRCNLQNVEFVTLPPIDPSINNNQSNILALVLSHIYHYAEKQYEKSINLMEQQSKISERNILVDLFQKCSKSIGVLDKDYKPQENGSLMDLVEQSKTSELRDNLCSLVHRILDMASTSHLSQAKYLVIPIDDADLDFSQMSATLELIRGYLMIPNVIILLAADTKMITSLITEHFREKLDPKSRQRADEATLISLVEQYMLKLFPPKQVIRLPNMVERLQLNRESIELIVLDKQEEIMESASDKKRRDIFTKQEKKILPEIDPDRQGYALEERLLRLVFKRTGLYFALHHDYQYILPETQRGIVHLVALLSQMEPVPYLLEREPLNDYSQSSDLHNPFQFPKGLHSIQNNLDFYIPNDSKGLASYVDNLKIWMHNIQLYHDYFMNEWVLANLNERDVRFMHQLSMVSLGKKNSCVLDYLQELEGAKVVRPDSNRLYAHMSSELNKYTKVHPNSRLEFAIQTLYSIIAQKQVLNILYAHYDPDSVTDRNYPVFLPLKELFGTVLIDDATVPIENYSRMDWIWKGGKKNSIQLALYLNLLHSNSNAISMVDSLQTYYYQLWNIDYDDERYNKRYIADLCVDPDTGLVTNFQSEMVANISTPILNSLFISDLFDIDAIEDYNKELVAQFILAHTIVKNYSLRILVNWDCRKEFIDYLVNQSYHLADITLDVIFSVYDKLARFLGITSDIVQNSVRHKNGNIYENILGLYNTWHEREVDLINKELKDINARIRETEIKHSTENKVDEELVMQERTDLAEEEKMCRERLDKTKKLTFDKCSQPEVHTMHDQLIKSDNEENGKHAKELATQVLIYALQHSIKTDISAQERKTVLKYVLNNQNEIYEISKTDEVRELLIEVRGMAVIQLIAAPNVEKTFWNKVVDVLGKLIFPDNELQADSSKCISTGDSDKEPVGS